MTYSLLSRYLKLILIDMERDTKLLLKYGILYPISFVAILGLVGWLFGA